MIVRHREVGLRNALDAELVIQWFVIGYVEGGRHVRYAKAHLIAGPCIQGCNVTTHDIEAVDQRSRRQSAIGGQGQRAILILVFVAAAVSHGEAVGVVEIVIALEVVAVPVIAVSAGEIDGERDTLEPSAGYLAVSSPKNRAEVGFHREFFIDLFQLAKQNYQLIARPSSMNPGMNSFTGIFCPRASPVPWKYNNPSRYPCLGTAPGVK